MSTAKKVAWILLVVTGVAIVAILGLVATSAIRPGRSIGMQQVAVGTPGGGQIPVTILYPTKAEASWTWLGLAAVKLAPNGPIDGQRHPLILISHGTGASSTSHLDTALALAERGYVVAAPLHAGDNFRDQSKVGTNAWIGDRAIDMRQVLNHLLGSWSGRSSLDPGKIGIFGFSAGGTTALVNVGGKLDSARLSRHCLRRPEFACTLLKQAARGNMMQVPESAHDKRIRAAVVAAPGFGFAFSPDSVALLDVPIQLWAGTADENVPAATNAGALRDLFSRAPDYHLVEGATHFSFLAPCGAMKLLLPKMLCTDAAGFDRKGFHTQFNNEVIRFFDKQLGGIE